jgi:translation initiation factor 1
VFICFRRFSLREVKTRIDTSGRQAALQSPFAALQLEGLPDGPAAPIASSQSEPPRKNSRVILRCEKAQRGGKTVVVVSGFENHIADSEIENLAREARQSCGCGGTIRDREIELQGDNPEKVRAFFEKAGFRVGGV